MPEHQFTISGMLGLGDNIYQRAFMKRYSEPVGLITPWPEIYEDLPNVRCIKPNTTLRTQLKNVRRQGEWSTQRGMIRRVHYGRNGIMPGLTAAFGFEPAAMDLPDYGEPLVSGDYVLVRPVTIRAEWRAEARNPLPEYVAEAAAVARRHGLTVVSVADLQRGAEWALDPLPEADVVLHAGELDTRQLLALAQNARALIGGVGWIVPAALAAAVPAWVVCGGQGGFNAPERITPSWPHPITFAVPDNFCRCVKRVHDCDKRISGYSERLARWAGRTFGCSGMVA